MKVWGSVFLVAALALGGCSSSSGDSGGTTGGINIVALFCEWAATTLGQDKLSFSFFRILQW